MDILVRTALVRLLSVPNSWVSLGNRKIVPVASLSKKAKASTMGSGLPLIATMLFKYYLPGFVLLLLCPCENYW